MSVDWDKTTNNGYNNNDINNSNVLLLLSDLVQSIQVWYNVTETAKTCIDWQRNENTKIGRLKNKNNLFSKNKINKYDDIINDNDNNNDNNNNNDICNIDNNIIDSLTAWDIITCNEGLNLVNWRVQGITTIIIIIIATTTITITLSRNMIIMLFFLLLVLLLMLFVVVVVCGYDYYYYYYYYYFCCCCCYRCWK